MSPKRGGAKGFLHNKLKIAAHMRCCFRKENHGMDMGGIQTIHKPSCK